MSRAAEELQAVEVQAVEVTPTLTLVVNYQLVNWLSIVTVPEIEMLLQIYQIVLSLFVPFSIIASDS